MFFFIGIFMTVVQGGYSRRIKQGKHIRSAYIAILLLIPSFIIIALAGDQMKFYLGLMLYSYSSAVVVPCLTTVTSNYGNDDEKGTITGIVRSLGALARAFGPIFTSMSNLFSSISINLVKTTTKQTYFFYSSLLDVWLVVCVHFRKCWIVDTAVYIDSNRSSYNETIRQSGVNA